LNNYPGWLASLIIENQCGYSVAPDDPSAFADALEVAADNKQNLPVMGQRAQILARKEFNRHDLADKWVHWVTKEALKDDKATV
jgi:glycosyltransferase involved in cell wall biosynthesis